MQSFLIEKTVESDYTEPEAFFLGGMIMCCDEHHGREYLSLVRHNPGFVGSKQIAEHRKAIESLAGRAGGCVTNLDSRKFDGFAVHFSSRTDKEQTLIDRAEQIVKHGAPSARSALLSGIFDGRASYDRRKGTAAATQFVVDCPRNYEEQVSDLVVTLARQFGIQINTNFSRERLSGGNPRKTQLRMRSSDAERFFTQVGLVSPAKMERALEIYSAKGMREKDPINMPGLLVLDKSGTQRAARREQPQRISCERKQDQSQAIRRKPLKSIAQAPKAKPIVQEKAKPVIAPSNKKWLKPEELAKIKVGATVTHKEFGSGVVTYLDSDHINVRVGRKERMFSFPGAFEDGYLSI